MTCFATAVFVSQLDGDVVSAVEQNKVRVNLVKGNVRLVRYTPVQNSGLERLGRGTLDC